MAIVCRWRCLVLESIINIAPLFAGDRGSHSRTASAEFTLASTVDCSTAAIFRRGRRVAQRQSREQHGRLPPVGAAQDPGASGQERVGRKRAHSIASALCGRFCVLLVFPK